MTSHTEDTSYLEAHDRLTGYMRSRGLKLTRQREEILQAFLSARRHVSVEELLRAVREQNSGIGHATIYRAMKLFVESGLATERRFADAPTLYEASGGDGHHHHDHLICTSCGLIVEFENDEIENLQEVIAHAAGFTLTDHKMELYGLCPACKAD